MQSVKSKVVSVHTMKAYRGVYKHSCTHSMKFSCASSHVKILKFSVSETDSVPEMLENFNIVTQLLA
jgi:hypothetical protein